MNIGRRNTGAALVAALTVSFVATACAGTTPGSDHQEKSRRRPESGEVSTPVDSSTPDESTPDTVSVAAAAPQAPVAPAP